MRHSQVEAAHPVAESDRLLTVEEFASRMRAPIWTVRYWIWKRKISSYRFGRTVFIPSSEIERLLSVGYRPAKIHDNTLPLDAK